MACENKPKKAIKSEVASSEKAVTKTAPVKKSAPVTDHYICFKDNTKPSRVIWVSYDDTETAIRIKHKGQNQSIPLKFTHETSQKGGISPAITKHYDEIYEGQKNGTYSITHSGNWDYVKYTRAKDGKEFNFTIDHTANPYGKSPCF